MNMVVTPTTQTHTITLSAFHWQALALFTDPKDVRYMINGINISAKHLTATDGKVLMCLEHGHDFGDFLPEHGVTVEAFKASTKRVGGNDPTVTLTISETGGTHYGVVTATCSATPGTSQNLKVRMQNFVDYERVIPKHSESDEFSHKSFCDAKYLELIGKAGVLLAKGEGRKEMPTNIRGTENNAMFVTFSGLPRARAVVMPMRGDF